MSGFFEAWAPFARAAPTAVMIAAVVVFPVLFFITAPYGRHQRKGWGPSIPANLGWLIMESPSVFLFGALWWNNPDRDSPLVTLLGLVWLTHYVQRTFVFPVLMRGGGKPNALLTVAMAVTFNLLNASGNAVGLQARPIDLAFVVGVAVWGCGFVMNLHADAVLRGLRKPGETGYAIPFGGTYRFITSPNYLGEIVEWVGFAIAAQSYAALAFAVFTIANLAPRARSHHRWYREKFPDYPVGRKILLPGLW